MSPTSSPMPPARLPQAPNSKGVAFSIGLMVWLLVVITTTVVTFILPETFSSTARIKVERDHADITSLEGPQSTGGYDPYFIQTEFEVIQSQLILEPVIKDLNLNVEWGKKYGDGNPLKTDESMLLIKGRLSLRPVRNTSLIEITVYSDNAEDAARQANKIAEVYQKHRVNQRKDLMLGGIDALERRLEEQDQKVREAQANIERLLELKANDGTASTNAKSLAYVNAEHELERATKFRQTLESKIDAESIDVNLPCTSIVEIIDQAVPGIRPVRPDKGWNVTAGAIIGAVAGLLMGSLVWLLQRIATRRELQSGPQGRLQPMARMLGHLAVALLVSIFLGYNCAIPVCPGSLAGIVVAPLVGSGLSAYIELGAPPLTPSQIRSA